MALNSSQAFYLLINNKSVASMATTMLDVYTEDKDEDGFLYMTYASQEMFGQLSYSQCDVINHLFACCLVMRVQMSIVIDEGVS